MYKYGITNHQRKQRQTTKQETKKIKATQNKRKNNKTITH